LGDPLRGGVHNNCSCTGGKFKAKKSANKFVVVRLGKAVKMKKRTHAFTLLEFEVGKI
jgi:hypothetical protein